MGDQEERCGSVNQMKVITGHANEKGCLSIGRRLTSFQEMTIIGEIREVDPAGVATAGRQGNFPLGRPPFTHFL